MIEEFMRVGRSTFEMNRKLTAPYTVSIAIHPILVKTLVDDVVLVTISAVIDRVLIISTTYLVDVSIAVGVTL